MPNHTYILVGHDPVEEPDIVKWSKWFSRADRVVARTEVGFEHRGKVLECSVVLTIFRGVAFQTCDGPPLLFETFITHGGQSDLVGRWETWEEAQVAHQATLGGIAEFFAKTGRVESVKVETERK